MAVRPELVVGLGNPGPKYEGTRHNAGFWFADRLARRLGVDFRPVRRFALDACETGTEAGRVRLVKPTTYMNRSGQAVGAIAEYFRIAPAAILVVHDDLDLPPGTVRLKEGGGHGGHNGLRDIVAHLGTRDFARVRLGIGRPTPGRDAIDYVLERPRAEERRLIDDAIGTLLDWTRAVLAGDLQPVMKALHTRVGAGGDPAGEPGERETPRRPGGPRGAEGARGRGDRAPGGASPPPPPGGPAA